MNEDQYLFLSNGEYNIPNLSYTTTKKLNIISDKQVTLKNGDSLYISHDTMLKNINFKSWKKGIILNDVTGLSIHFDQLTFDGCEFGVRTVDTIPPATLYKTITITNSKFLNLTIGGIRISCFLEKCFINNNYFNSIGSGSGYGVIIGNNVNEKGCKDITIANNTLLNINGSTLNAEVQGILVLGERVNISDNIVKNINGLGEDSEGIYCKGTEIVIKGNHVVNGAGSDGLGDAGITVKGGEGKAIISENTVINDYGKCVLCEKSTIITNNYLTTNNSTNIIKCSGIVDGAFITEEEKDIIITNNKMYGNVVSVGISLTANRKTVVNANEMTIISGQAIKLYNNPNLLDTVMLTKEMLLNSNVFIVSGNILSTTTGNIELLSVSNNIFKSTIKMLNISSTLAKEIRISNNIFSDATELLPGVLATEAMLSTSGIVNKLFIHDNSFETKRPLTARGVLDIRSTNSYIKISTNSFSVNDVALVLDTLLSFNGNNLNIGSLEFIDNYIARGFNNIVRLTFNNDGANYKDIIVKNNNVVSSTSLVITNGLTTVCDWYVVKDNILKAKGATPIYDVTATKKLVQSNIGVDL